MLKQLAFARALMLALFAVPASAQVAGSLVAPCLQQSNYTCAPVASDNPLPTAPAYTAASAWADGTVAQDVRAYETVELEVTGLTSGQTVSVTRSIGGTAYVAHWLTGNDLTVYSDGVISANGIYSVPGRGYLKYAKSAGSTPTVSIQARN